MNKENVNHPSHYKDMGLESKEIIKLIINNLPEEISRWECVCIAMELKYRLRAGLKTGEFEEDFLKAMKWREFRNEEVEEDYKKEDEEEKFLKFAEEHPELNLDLREFMITFRPKQYKKLIEEAEKYLKNLEKSNNENCNFLKNLNEDLIKKLKEEIQLHLDAYKRDSSRINYDRLINSLDTLHIFNKGK